MRNQFLQHESGKFCILDLDDPMLAPALSDQLMEILSPDASGVVLGAETSYYAITKKAQKTGVIFSLDKKIDHDPLNIPPLIEGWSIEEIKNNYGVAKLTLEFHPREEQAVRKVQLVSELYDYAHHEDIDFWLEIIPIQLETDKTETSQLVLESVGMFKSIADCLVLPELAPLTAVTITADLDIPWVLSDRSSSYDQYKEALRASLESGASGFIAGNVLWQHLLEAPAEQSEPQTDIDIKKLISTTVRDRFLEISRITVEA